MAVSRSVKALKFYLFRLNLNEFKKFGESLNALTDVQKSTYLKVIKSVSPWSLLI
jgi:hypothetical protein